MIGLCGHECEYKTELGYCQLSVCAHPEKDSVLYSNYTIVNASEPKTMFFNVMCLNHKCKNYYEDFCYKIVEGEHICINEEGKCDMFEDGVNERYCGE